MAMMSGVPQSPTASITGQVGLLFNYGSLNVSDGTIELSGTGGSQGGIGVLDLLRSFGTLVLNGGAVTARFLAEINAELDDGTYPTGIKISDQELATVHLKRSPFHGDWNYCVLPARRKK